MDEPAKERDLLANLAEHEVLRIDNRAQMAFWGGAVDRLKEAGKIETEFVDLPEEQYSFLRIRLK